jgi:H+/Cl- antiporter ClcA
VSRNNLETVPARGLKLVPPIDSRNFRKVRELGKFIVIIGVIATLVGLVMWSGFAPKWLGRLPGDIRIEREHSSFYFPIVTCIVLSILLSLVFSLFSIFRR